MKSIRNVLVGLCTLASLAIMSTSAKADYNFSANSNMQMNDNGTSGTGWISFSGNGAITTSIHTGVNSWTDQGHIFFNVSYSANGYFENNPSAENPYYSFLEDQNLGLRSWSQNSIEIPGMDDVYATVWVSGYAGLWRDRNPDAPYMHGYGYGQINADNAVPVSTGSYYQINADGHWYADGGVTFMMVPTPGAIATFSGGLIAIARRRRR